MLNVVKKTLCAGVGAAVITKEVVDKALDEWVAKGRISRDEAESFSARLVSTGEAKLDESKAGLAVRVEELLTSANLATRARIEALESRVVALEIRLAAAERARDSESSF